MKRLILICLLAPALFAQCVWKTIPGTRNRYQDCAGTASDAPTGASTLVTPGAQTKVGATAGTVAEGSPNFTQTGTGAVARTVDDKLQDFVSVKDFGADCSGVADSAGAMTAAIAALPPTGGEILVPNNCTLLFATGVTTGTRPVKFTGSGKSSIITGSGITILTLAADLSSVDNLNITDSVGSDSTICIDVNNGASGVSRWSIKNSSCVGTSQHGIGIRTIFALSGEITGNVIEGWSSGVSLTNSGAYRSNANKFVVNRIRYNTFGIDVPTAGADNFFAVGNTIEGNATCGIRTASGKASVFGNHFENTVSNVCVSGASDYQSHSNGYYGAPANNDIVVADGAGVHSSLSDTLNAGITHNGTGQFTVLYPVFALTTAGTGKLLEVSGTKMAGTNLSSTAFTLSGLLYWNFMNPVYFNDSTIGSPSGGGGSWAFTPGAGSNGNLNLNAAGSKKVFTGGANLCTAGSSACWSTSAGAPVGSCVNGAINTDTTNGNLYVCQATAWSLVAAPAGTVPARKDYTFACKANIIGGTLTNIVVSSNAATATCTAGGCGAINGQTMYVIGASDADLNKAYTVVSSGATDTTVTFTTADVADGTITDAGMSFQGCLLNGASSTLGITNDTIITPVLFELPAGSKVIGSTVYWPAAWTGPGTLTASVGAETGADSTFYAAASNLMAATGWLDTSSYKSKLHTGADDVTLVMTANAAFGDGTLPTLKLNGSVTVSVTW